jgi:hypothetical protein
MFVPINGSVNGCPLRNRVGIEVEVRDGVKVELEVGDGGEVKIRQEPESNSTIPRTPTAIMMSKAATRYLIILPLEALSSILEFLQTTHFCFDRWAFVSRIGDLRIVNQAFMMMNLIL